MRLLVQRSKNSNVTINNIVNGKINKGLVVLVGFTHNDDEQIVDKMIDKMINLRIFSDENDLMNLSLLDISGEVLSISQFTLYADITGGRRPSFTKSMDKNKASNLYDYFNEKLRKIGIKVETGVFGADMIVNITNDGPTTILIDSEEIIK